MWGNVAMRVCIEQTHRMRLKRRMRDNDGPMELSKIGKIGTGPERGRPELISVGRGGAG